MNCKKIILILTLIFITNCTTTIQKNNKNIISIEDQYSNKGFTMIYDEDLFKKKMSSMPGLFNRLTVLIPRLLPESLLIKVSILIFGSLVKSEKGKI